MCAPCRVGPPLALLVDEVPLRPPPASLAQAKQQARLPPLPLTPFFLCGALVAAAWGAGCWAGCGQTWGQSPEALATGDAETGP